jgi:hypothetical protein
VQRCKSEQSSCAKVQKWRRGRLQRTECGVERRKDYRVQSTEYGGRSAVSCEDRAKVQIGAELLCKGGKVNDKTGRGVALPRPP